MCDGNSELLVSESYDDKKKCYRMPIDRTELKGEEGEEGESTRGKKE